jgi:L-ribulose-5-phosphate 3-epimerase
VTHYTKMKLMSAERSFPLTRRALLAGLSASAAALAQTQTGPNALPVPLGPKPRVSPSVVVTLEQFPKIGYNEIGDILKAIGFDGCILSVQPGGHIKPESADWELMRAVEAVTGVGLDVPALSTLSTSPSDPILRLIFGVGGQMQIPFFQPGQWKYPASGSLDARIPEIQRDLAVLSSFANQTKMTVAIRNTTGENFGAALWDAQMLVRGIDPIHLGYDFDIGYATAHGGPDAAAFALRTMLPRLKMVAARDILWTKDSSGWKLTECPLGEGMVDWSGFFATLARAHFTGPVTVYVNYQTPDMLAAIRRDLAFLRKQLAAAYSLG